MLVKFNSEVQTLIIDVTSSSIIKKFDVQSTDFNFLFQINTATVIVSFTTNVDNTFMTILSIIFKNKLIKSDKMRFYKDLNVKEHVR